MNLLKSIKPVLFVLTSHDKIGDTDRATGYYLGEVTHPLFVLENADIKVEFASIQGGNAPVDGLELDDKINAHYWNNPEFRKLVAHTLPLIEVDSNRYSAVFFAGGHGTMWDFPESEAVQRIARNIYEAGGVVAAVCHGPSALVNVKLSDGSYLVSGKKVSAFTNDEEHAAGLDHIVPFRLATKLIERGALHQPKPNWNSNVVVDERLITGQNPQSATGVGEAIRSLLLK